MWTVCLLVVLPLAAGLPRPSGSGSGSDSGPPLQPIPDKGRIGLGVLRLVAAEPPSDEDDGPPILGGDKRSLTGAQDYPDSDYGSASRYDEYPMVMPRVSKRTAVMVDRLFGMLKNAVNGDVPAEVRAIAPDDRMDLQRRGQQKGRVYWRCYFNAVTCFRRRK